jgi:hypothetical protein
MGCYFSSRGFWAPGTGLEQSVSEEGSLHGANLVTWTVLGNNRKQLKCCLTCSTRIGRILPRTETRVWPWFATFGKFGCHNLACTEHRFSAKRSKGPLWPRGIKVNNFSGPYISYERSPSLMHLTHLCTIEFINIPIPSQPALGSLDKGQAASIFRKSQWFKWTPCQIASELVASPYCNMYVRKVDPESLRVQPPPQERC